MGHSLDLKNLNIRTDLAIDVINALGGENGFTKTEEKDGDMTITTVIVDESGEKVINKKKGKYVTIEFVDATDYDNSEAIAETFYKHLKVMLDDLKLGEEAKCLVIGLGNKSSTPDALGPKAIEQILVTRHLFSLGADIEEGFRNVAAFTPGVMGETGIETSDLIFSTVNTVKPDFVIVIDALASSSLTRVNKTIQLTDTGIHPGSGVGNERKEISREVLGIPVVAVGIPTVVDAITIVGDTIGYTIKHFENTDAKKEILGLLPELSDQELKQLLFEVLNDQGFNLMVTPKEIDFLIEKLSTVLAHGINKTLHKNVE